MEESAIQYEVNLNKIYNHDFSNEHLPGDFFQKRGQSHLVIKDGRVMAFLLEIALPSLFPELQTDTYQKCFIDEQGEILIRPDMIDDDGVLYDQKTLVLNKNGSWIPSCMKGAGRKINYPKANRIAKGLIYVWCDIANYPHVRIIFRAGHFMIENFPKGSITKNQGKKILFDESIEEKRIFDQYYTKNNIAEECYKLFRDNVKDDYDFILEPAAGTGAFFNLLPKDKRIGIDLYPKCANVAEKDFFKYVPPKGKFCVIGNPPFGRNSSLALKFFNRSAEFCNTIAFILPRTFIKPLFQNKLNLNFHLIKEQILLTESFIFNGKDYNVPCVFQIWEKQTHERKKIVYPKTHSDFFIVDRKDADFAFQRVGADAGKIKTKFKKCANASHYFIKIKHNNVIENLNKIDFKSVKYNTAGNPSIGWGELIWLYSKINPDKNIKTSTFNDIF